MVLAFGENVNVISVIHVLLIVYGAYSLVSAGKMKRDREISQWLLSANELPRVRDRDGFCDAMTPPTLAFGLSCIIYGLIALFNTYYLDNEILHFILLIAFLVCIIWYVTSLRKAKKEYIYY